MAVGLFALANGFQIWKELVISSTISNKRLENGGETMRPADVKKPIDVKELLVFCYK